MIANFLYRNSRNSKYQKAVPEWNFRLLWYAVRSEGNKQAAATKRELWEVWRAGRPPDLFGWEKTVPKRVFPTPVVRGRGGGGYSSFRKGSMLGGAGGPDALQTSCAREKAQVG